MKQDIDLQAKSMATVAAAGVGAERHAGKVAQEDSSKQERKVTTTVIRARPGWHLLNVRELWRYRELLGFLAMRDIKIRYRQTLFGVLWAIVPPIMLMVVFTFIFGKVAGFDTSPIPYPLFVFPGLLAWRFFTTALSDSIHSVVNSGPMISKVYFPRLILPFSRVAVATIDFAIACAVLACLMVYYQFLPGWRILYVPPIVLLIAMTALGAGTFLAAINVAFRDVRHMISFAIQIGLLLTPAIYMDTSGLLDDVKTTKRVEQAAPQDEQPTATAESESKPSVTNSAKRKKSKKEKPGKEGLVPDRFQNVLHLNPMMGFISSFRAAILNKPLPWRELGYATLFSLTTFILGCLYFERVQRKFADII